MRRWAWVLVGLRKRLLEAELHQRDVANRDSLTEVRNRRHLDAILRQGAQRIQSTLRATDTLARIGGDEFAIIASGAPVPRS